MTGSETEARRGPVSVFGPTPYLEKESEYSTEEGQTERRGNRTDGRTADVMGATTTIGATSFLICTPTAEYGLKGCVNSYHSRLLGEYLREKMSKWLINIGRTLLL